MGFDFSLVVAGGLIVFVGWILLIVAASPKHEEKRRISERIKHYISR